MRCLYCDKKLSLLKIAKGDSFCSPEHFDAHQLQLSRSAYQRMSSQTEQDAPVAPLMVLTPDEDNEPVNLEADAALARLSAFGAQEEPANGLAEPPPCEFFTGAWMTSYAPNPSVPLPDLTGHLEPRRELEFPVLDSPPTDSLLNLHLGLGRSDAHPQNWAPMQQDDGSPENFQPGIAKPSFAVIPSFKSDEPPFESPAPAIESSATESILNLQQGLDITETRAPQQTEESPENFQLEIAKPSLAVIPDAPRIESSEPEPRTNTEPRLAYLSAPSFLARDLEVPHLDIAAGSAADGFLLVPMVDPILRPRLEGHRSISAHTGFAKTSLSPQDSVLSPIQGCAGLKVQTPPVLPENIEKAGLGGWHDSNGPAAINRKALEIAPPATPSMGFRQHESVTVCPDPPVVPILDRAKTLNSTGTLASLFLSVLKTSPLGREPVFSDRSAQAFQSSLPVALSPSAMAETVSSATWQNQPSYFLLPTSILEARVSPKFTAQPLHSAPACVMPASFEPTGQILSLADLPYRPIAWRRTDFELAPGPGPVPSSVAPPLRLFSPQNAADHLELGANMAFEDVSKMALTPGERGVFGQPDPASVAVTTLPRAGVEVRALSIGLSPLSVTWESSVSTRHDMTAARFLPVRRGATLPAARMWPRLGPLRP